ncbi:MAG: hydrogenase maturation protease [Verrucomicrobia bacterium]|nr:hydrogenase maturation protease [Verrucomicrobiota bacterium]
MLLLDTTLVGKPARALPIVDQDTPVLILAVGNLLMGDEGAGIHFLRRLESETPVPGARLLDGGVAGITLLEDIQRARAVIMVDATRDGGAAGTVKLLRPRTIGALPQGLSSHDFGLKDLFAAAALLGSMPEVHLFTISVETVHPMCLQLSPPVAAAIPRVLDSVRMLAAQLVVRD